MALSFSTTLRNSRSQAIIDAIGTSGVIRFYSGTPPANVGASLSGNTVLAELAASSAFAPAPSGGVLTANSITQDSSADATGTATFFRALTSGGTAVVQGTVGTSGSDINLVTTSIVAGQPVQISSLVWTEGNS